MGVKLQTPLTMKDTGKARDTYPSPTTGSPFWAQRELAVSPPQVDPSIAYGRSPTRLLYQPNTFSLLPLLDQRSIGV